MSDNSLFNRFGKTFPKDTVIFEEDEKGNNIFIIQEGEIQLSKKVRNSDHPLAILSKGDFFGEMSIFSDKPRSATATAITDVKLIVLDKQMFEQMIRDNKEIGLRIIKKLVARLEEADNIIEYLLIEDPTSRVVNVILKSAKQHGSGNERGLKIDIDLSIRDLSTRIGLNDEIIKQIMNKLKRSGVIFERSGHICITSMGMLEKYIKYLEMKNQFEGVSSKQSG